MTSLSIAAAAASTRIWDDSLSAIIKSFAVMSLSEAPTEDLTETKEEQVETCYPCSLDKPVILDAQEDDDVEVKTNDDRTKQTNAIVVLHSRQDNSAAGADEEITISSHKENTNQEYADNNSLPSFDLDTISITGPPDEFNIDDISVVSSIFGLDLKTNDADDLNTLSTTGPPDDIDDNPVLSSIFGSYLGTDDDGRCSAIAMDESKEMEITDEMDTDEAFGETNPMNHIEEMIVVEEAIEEAVMLDASPLGKRSFDIAEETEALVLKTQLRASGVATPTKFQSIMFSIGSTSLPKTRKELRRNNLRQRQKRYRIKQQQAAAAYGVYSSVQVR